MKINKMIDNKIIGSLVNCKYKAFLKSNGEKGKKTEYELMQDELLEEYKKRFISNIKEKYNKNKVLYDFKFEDNKYFRKKYLIVNPKLRTEDYNISFDFLEIIPPKPPNQKRLFIPIMISPKENLSKIEKLILCIKVIILSDVYGINCKFARVIYGGELKTLKFKVEPFLMEARRLLDELNKIINKNYEPLIFQKNHCKICEFQNKCYKKLKDEDSLALFRKINERSLKKYNGQGIFTVNQLSYTFNPKRRGKRVKANDNPYYLSLKALAIRDNKPYIYDNINIPRSKTQIFVDMEGNSDSGSIYLIGVLIKVDNEKSYMHSLYVDDFKNEKGMFMKFFEILDKFRDAHIFYFGNYERRVFKRVISFKPKKNILDILINRSTNVLDLIYSNIYIYIYIFPNLL